jgi:hypothetical protein
MTGPVFPSDKPPLHFVMPFQAGSVPDWPRFWLGFHLGLKWNCPKTIFEQRRKPDD